MKGMVFVFLSLFCLVSAHAERLPGLSVLEPDRAALPALLSAYQWVTYAFWKNETGHPIRSLRTTWNVPTEPATQGGQLIYFFNGLEPSNRSAIVQPVLQWGSSPAGGGDYWAVGCWYVTKLGGYSTSKLVRVHSGDSLTGIIARTGGSGDSFSYHCEFEGIDATKLDVDGVRELDWAAETLETYGTSRCSEYPGDVNFTRIALETDAGTAPLQWTSREAVTDCGQHLTIVSDSATDGEVDIHMRR